MTEQSPKQFMGLLKNDFLHIQTPKEERLFKHDSNIFDSQNTS